MHDISIVNKLTYVNINPGICDSQTDIIRHRHIDTEDPRVVEEVSKDELAVRGGAHSIADGRNWHMAVCIRHYSAHFSGEAKKSR